MEIKEYKRVFDIIFSLATLLVWGPLTVLTYIISYILEGRPVIFTQKRIGYNGRIFTIYKFRTMKNLRDKNGNLLPDDYRLTKFGSFLRKTNLDELPQFFNVLKGDMSVVGPRPLPSHYINRFTTEQFRRHCVRPGITGWAQVNGRNLLSWTEKFKYDLWYVDNYSFSLDLVIVFMTIWKIFRREGINQPGRATVEEFKGSNPR